MALFFFNPERLRVPLLNRLIPSILKRWVKLTTPSGFRVARADGLVFLVRCDNYVDRHILYYGEFEKEQTQFLEQQIRAHNVDMFIDVGANFGYYTILAAIKWNITDVIALEPDPRNYLHLCASLFLNQLAGKVRCFELAASEQTGTTGFLMSKDSATGCSHITEEDAAQTKVRTCRLDELIDVRNRTIALKIDVEGHELSVLDGMPDLLTQNNCLLQIECFENNLDSLNNRLEKLGYGSIHRIGSDHYFVKNNPTA